MTYKHETQITKKHHLGTVSKTDLLEGLKMFDGANLTLISDVDQDIYMFGSRVRSLTSSMYHISGY